MAGASLLPDDVLHIICDQLGHHQRDFSALFSCALTARRWSDPALVTLYRLYHLSPIGSRGSEETEFNRQAIRGNRDVNAEQEPPVPKWAVLWRSITLSSLNWTAAGSPTYREYCRYIRVLNLRDLAQFLQDNRLDSCTSYFFQKPLDSFYFKKPPQKGKRGKLFSSVDTLSIIRAIGDAVTKKTLTLEDISDPIRGNGLPAAWIRQSPKLRSITVWNGAYLSNGAEEAIRANCPYFRSLSIYEWRSNTADFDFAQFVNGLSPNTLRDFDMISYHDLGASAFQALCHHSSSLTDLRISNLCEGSLAFLNHLKGCTALRSLFLHDLDGSISLEARHNDVFLEVTSWLTSCTSLKQISLQRFLDGPTLLSAIVQTPTIQLEKLSVTGYSAATPSAQAFHSALASHPSLTSLSIKADADDADPTDRLALVQSICALPLLRELELKDISDDFGNMHIIRLAQNLPNLEYLWVSGESVTDPVLPALATLRNLRNLMLYALTKFSAYALFHFVDSLEMPGNRGFQLSVVNAEAESDLSRSELALIKDRIAEKVEGSFEFIVYRDEDSFGWESD